MGFRLIAVFSLLVAVTLVLFGCGSQQSESLSANWTGFQSPLSPSQSAIEFVPRVSALGPGDKVPMVFLIRLPSTGSEGPTGKVVTVSSALGALIEPSSDSTVYAQILATPTVHSNTTLPIDDKGKVMFSYTAPRLEGIDVLTISGYGFREDFPISILASSALRYSVTMTPSRGTLSFGDRALVSVSVARSDGILPTGSMYMYTSSGVRLVKTDSSGNDVPATMFDVKAGKASAFYVAGRTPLSDTITATFNDATAQVPMTVVPSASLSYNVSVSAAQAELVSGRSTLLTITVTDQKGAPGAGKVFLSSALGGTFSLSSTGASDGTFPTLNPDGQTTAFYQAGTLAGPDTITATFREWSGTATVRVNPTSPGTFSITLWTNVSSLKTKEQALLSIEAKDSSGKPVNGQALLSSSLGGLFLKPNSYGGVSETSVAVLENGKATILFEAGPFGGTTIISTAIPGASATLPISITSQPPYLLEMIPEAPILASGTTMAINVRIRNRKGLPLDSSSGQNISISATSGTLQTSSTSGSTTASTVTLSSVTDSQAVIYRAVQSGTVILRATSANAEEAWQLITIID